MIEEAAAGQSGIAQFHLRDLFVGACAIVGQTDKLNHLAVRDD